MGVTLHHVLPAPHAGGGSTGGLSNNISTGRHRTIQVLKLHHHIKAAAQGLEKSLYISLNEKHLSTQVLNLAGSPSFHRCLLLHLIVTPLSGWQQFQGLPAMAQRGLMDP